MKTNYKQGICSECGKEALIVHKSRKLCMICTSRFRNKRIIERRKQRVEDGKEIDPNKLSVFYQSYWNRHPERFCVECSIELRSFKRWHIHHLIPKKNWKEYDTDIVYNDGNCVYVCLECHSRAETSLETTETIKKITEEKQREFEPFRNNSKNGNTRRTKGSGGNKDES